jgi:type IV pilus assembly protein PilC
MTQTIATKETFNWKARDLQGRELNGTQIASSENAVASTLRSQGLLVISISSESLSSPNATTVVGEPTLKEPKRRVKVDEIITFCQQLSIMVETGVPLSDSLKTLAAQCKQGDFKLVVEDIYKEVCSGEALSTALARRGKIFPHIVTSLIRASELSGQLALMLDSVSIYLAKERKIVREVKGALAYPMIMGVTAILVTSLIMTFVLPRFAKIYEMRSTSLPLPTKILMGLSNGLTSSWMYWVPAVVVLTIGTLIWIKTLDGRKRIDWMKLNLPILGPMFRQLYTTRASRTLSTLLGAGVGILDAIGICREVTNNIPFDRMWTDMEVYIRNGQPMSDAVFESPYVPQYVASMMASGEQSGRLPEVMDKVANFADEELEVRVKTASSMIEPLMILIMGSVVGGVAIAMLLPIFSMSKVITN